MARPNRGQIQSRSFSPNEIGDDSEMAILTGYFLMRSLVQAILSANVFGVGSIVPVQDYRTIFPHAGEYDPYFPALKHTLINMAKVGAGPSVGSRDLGISSRQHTLGPIE